MTHELARTARVKRRPERARYERETIHAILDEGLVAHVAIIDAGNPVVIPMVYARDGERVLLHGSPGSRLQRVLRSGAPMSLSVTLIDGLVLARSAAHHSMNYRSVVVLGHGVEITDADEKAAAFRRIVEHVVPERYDDCRQANAHDFKTTQVVAVSLEHASAKIRSGPPVDEESDYATRHWAGVVPLSQTWGEPQADARLDPGVPIPDYLRGYRRPV